MKTRRRFHPVCSAICTAFAAAVMLPSCGVGLAGAAAGVASGDESTVESARLLRSESSPALLDVQPVEPTTSIPSGLGVIPPGTDPTGALLLRFSAPLAQPVRAEDVLVEVKRPLGPFVSVSVQSVITEQRTVRVVLAGETVLNSLYRVDVRGAESVAGSNVATGGPSYFVVRDGYWTEAETVSSGGSRAAATRLGEDGTAYALLASRNPSSDGVQWLTGLTSARPDEPWQFPSFVSNRFVSNDEAGVRLSVGGLVLNDRIGFFRMSEGDVDEGRADNIEVVLRAPVGEVTPAGDLSFGPLVTMDMLDDTMGRIDLPGEPSAPDVPEFLPGAPHFAYPGPIVESATSVGTAFWGLSSPEDTPDGNVFAAQRVYANSLTKEVGAGQPSWANWGSAAVLSAPGVDHNSWPILCQASSGDAYALWWSAPSTDGVFAASVGRYWLSIWTPGDTWADAVDVTPTGEVERPPITDVHVIERGAERRLLVFFRSPVGPTAREFDPALGAWSTAEGPALSSVIPQVPTIEEFTRIDDAGHRSYGGLRSQIGAMTPIAQPIGANEFLVRWVDDIAPAGGEATVLASLYRADAATRWSPEPSDSADFGSVVSVTADAPHRSNLLLTVDPNGWASLVTRRLEGGTSQVFVQRASLLVGGVGGLLDAPSFQVSRLPYDATSPAVSNSTSSGSSALFWIPNDPATGNFLGTAASRFR